jgi:hypothetical protein
MTARPIAAVSTSSGATTTADLDVRRLGTLTVLFKLAGTVTTGDLTVFDPLPQLADGTFATVGLPAEATTAPVSDGTNVVAARRYDVSGTDKVRLSAKNNNAGALALTVDVVAEYAGRS